MKRWVSDDVVITSTSKLLDNFVNITEQGQVNIYKINKNDCGVLVEDNPESIKEISSKTSI